MKQEGLRFFAQTDWLVAAMLLFLVIFIGVGIWVFKTSNRHYEELSHLPFEDSKDS